MENLKTFELTELSQDEMIDITGGFWLQALVFVASAIIGYIFADSLYHLYGNKIYLPDSLNGLLGNKFLFSNHIN